jgi:L,D-peptidoglycan transpeptidase YkuD (ErfK/YbiS/YcfS/YnhG family)
MKNPLGSLKKAKLTTRLLFAVVALVAVGLVAKRAAPRAQTRPTATFAQDTGPARQVIVVRATSALTNEATLEAQEFDGSTWRTVVGPVKAHIGRNGFSPSHQEGDGTTPQGVFNLTEAFGNQKRPTGAHLPYARIDQNSWWVSDPDSPVYNTWHVGPPAGLWRESFGERLDDPKYRGPYRYAVVIDYNREPVKPYAGSAIFLHVGSGPTSGCVAIDEASVVKILDWLDPAKAPKIVMGIDKWLLDPIDAPSVAGTEAVGLKILPPARILDTRSGVGVAGGLTRRVGPKSITTLNVRGNAGVPDDATVVALNLTVTEPTLATFLTISPGGADGTPNASNVNVHAGDARAALVLARIGADGAIRIANDAGDTHIIADVVGYGSPNVIGGLEPRTPQRVLSTRDGIGMADPKSRSPLGPNTSLDFPLPNVPANATAVVLNITATNASEATFISAFAGGTPRPDTSTLNVHPRQDTANLAIVPLGQGNTVRFYNSAGDTHVIADVFGYILADRGDRYVAADQPTRIIDTRSGVGVRGQIGPGTDAPLSLIGIPANATAIAVTVTGVNASEVTEVQVFPTDPGTRNASNLNLSKIEPAANLVIVPVGSVDHKDIIRTTRENTDIIVDVNGWFVKHA